MKKQLIYSFVVLTGMFAVSCGDYLKTDSGDLLMPQSLTEYIPVLYGEGYPRTFNSDAGWISIMTDDVEVSPLEWDPAYYDTPPAGFDLTNCGDGNIAYQWAYGIEDKIADGFWPKRYANILGCNTIIHALPTMEYAGTQLGKYNMLAAQAYALRAYNYFCLVNTYSLPWSESNLDKPGVVIRTSPEISVTARDRATIGKVYELINDDIETAMEYTKLCEPSGNKHLISPAAIQLLATRVALFQHDWDKVISVGTVFLEENTAIFDLRSVSGDNMGLDGSKGFYIRDVATNNEIVFTFGNGSQDAPYFSSSIGCGYYQIGIRTSINDIYDNDDETDPARNLLQKSLISCYEEGDLRELAFFQKDVFISSWDEYWEYYYHMPRKYRTPTGRKGYYECWRTVEVLLNVAEAHAQNSAGVSGDAIALLNRLRERRFTAATYVPKTASDFADKQQLIEFIWEERRRELCFDELIRWWDLRRQDMPQIIHRYYTSTTKFDTYILREGANNYTLPIPQSEITVNDDITLNPRDVIVPNS